MDAIPTGRFYEPSISFPITIHYRHDTVYVNGVKMTEDLRRRIVRSYERRTHSGT